MIRRRVVVSGDVHGVFFRDTCRRTADGLGVAGWVRNLPDGTVEAVYEGEPERVQKLVDWAHQGPPLATVDAVSVGEEEPEGLTGFEIRPTPAGF
ncbi:acylphosphatase [Streptomyces sp. P9-2B-2]|uniref:acylphosphatase n=1 Tax=Streptomyces TaxID=1883 RepID=UPI001B3C7C5C|nr:MULTISPECIES: acylphosphatase [Streptomyces]MCX4635708.1 acylphosphatase [Streptomyces platensis]WJY42081.1 acylphosphatase [Streptomyces sp. P9-2B-2]